MVTATVEHLARIEQIAAEAIERHSRAALAASDLFGKESALTYALGYIEPVFGRPADEELAKIRGVFAGLRAAGVPGWADPTPEAVTR